MKINKAFDLFGQPTWLDIVLTWNEANYQTVLGECFLTLF